MKRVILTGVGGFVGSHCLEYFLEKTDWHILGIDSFMHKGTQSRINAVFERIDSINPKHRDRFQLFNHDLSVPIDRVLNNQLMGRGLNGDELPIDYIINMASDSAVERSVSDPTACLRNNYNLAINMLEFAREVKPKKFFQISTDEVYGEARDKPHHEWDIILPSNPYAASKAAQEAIAISYWRSFHVPVILTNTMNIIAEWQDTEKFLPKLIWKIATDQPMEIYVGQDGNIGSRFYIHAKNMADALVFLSEKPTAMYREGAAMPDRYNIVGDVEMDNLEVAKFVAEVLGKKLNYKLVPPDSARPGYDKRYALDGAKMAGIGWKAPMDTKESIKQIVNWTIEHPWWVI